MEDGNFFPPFKAGSLCLLKMKKIIALKLKQRCIVCNKMMLGQRYKYTDGEIRQTHHDYFIDASKVIQARPFICDKCIKTDYAHMILLENQI